MITDDDVMTLFEKSDPARVPAATPPLDADRYLETLRLRSTDVTLTDFSVPATPLRDRRNLMTLVAVILVAALLAGGAIAYFVRSTTRDSVTDQPVYPPAVVAINFLHAYAAYDADQVESFLAPDAKVTAMWTGPDWRLGLRYMEATELELIDLSCEVVDSSPSLSFVQCPYAYNGLGSDELGLGPYGGSSIGLTIRDGKVVDAKMNIPTDRTFRTQMWEPFANWVATDFPEDAAVMYTDSSHIAAAITAQSLPLWEQHTREYADYVKQRPGA